MKRPRVIAALLVALIAVLSAALFVGMSSLEPATHSTTQHYTCNVVNTFPHDSTAFTEGLIYQDGFLYESTGLNGASSLRKVNLTTGTVLQEFVLPNEYFGEGLARVDDKLVQLTYKTQVSFIYDEATFALLGNFTYQTEGWGLTYDGNRLIMSDGSKNLYFLNPETYQKTGQVQVHDCNVSISDLNELEYVNGSLYANVFMQAKIAIINPQTGSVTAWIDLTELANGNPAGVLNGIAYDPAGNRLFVTGKNWSYLYQVDLVPEK
jgi:glutaminyl-peptide cyclotransferase